MKPIREYSGKDLDALKEYEPHRKSTSGTNHRIGDYIRIVKHPHRFEFIVSNGVDRASIRELATKIFLHLRGLSKKVKISLLLQTAGHKHRTLLSTDKLHGMSYTKLLSFLKKQLPKRIHKPKHLVLHQFNASGGLLFSETVHEPLLRNYFTF